MFSTTEQKEKPTEEELLSKKTEAANRRKVQVEKAARESEVCFCSLNYSFFPLLIMFNFMLELEDISN